MPPLPLPIETALERASHSHQSSPLLLLDNISPPVVHRTAHRALPSDHFSISRNDTYESSPATAPSLNLKIASHVNRTNNSFLTGHPTNSFASSPTPKLNISTPHFKRNDPDHHHPLYTAKSTPISREKLPIHHQVKLLDHRLLSLR